MPTREQILRLPDGDGLVLHDNVPPGWRPGDRVGVVIHGLTGSHDSPGVHRVAARLWVHGLRTVRLDQRGAGKGLPLARGAYHAGRSDDVRAALEEVHRRSPASPIVVCSEFRLAAALAPRRQEKRWSIRRRILARGGDEPAHRHRPLRRPTALPRNRIYDQYFTQQLVDMARQRQRYFPDLPPLRFPRRMTTRLFDDLYTAPRGGFDDAVDYYRRVSSFPIIDRISVPTRSSRPATTHSSPSNRLRN